MGHLAEGMHTCVGAACSMNDDFFLGDFSGRVVQCALNRWHARLKLPAVKVRAVVGDCQLDIPHGPAGIIAR